MFLCYICIDFSVGFEVTRSVQSFKSVKSKQINILHFFQACRVKSHSWFGLIMDCYLSDTFRINTGYGLFSSAGFLSLQYMHFLYSLGREERHFLNMK